MAAPVVSAVRLRIIGTDGFQYFKRGRLVCQNFLPTQLSVHLALCLNRKLSLPNLHEHKYLPRSILSIVPPARKLQMYPCHIGGKNSSPWAVAEAEKLLVESAIGRSLEKASKYTYLLQIGNPTSQSESQQVHHSNGFVEVTYSFQLVHTPDNAHHDCRSRRIFLATREKKDRCESRESSVA